MLAVFILDCAESKVVARLMADGRMPALASLAGRGATVPLTSDAHLLDGAVMQTLLTGVGPGVHGIHKYVQLVPGTYDYADSQAADSPVPQIWQALSAQGLECCVFDVPKAFAHPGIRGRLVSCWGAYAPAARPGSVPEGLRGRLVGRFGRHPQPEQVPLPLEPRRYGQVLDRLLLGCSARAGICRLLLEEAPCDFFVTAFCESHVAAHQFWHLRDPSHPMFDARAARSFGDALERIYAGIDAAIGRTIEALPAGATVMAFTQQGVESNFSGSHLLPEWLQRRAGLARGRRALRPPVRLASALSSSLRAALHARLPRAVVRAWLKRKYPASGPVFLLPGSEFMALLRVNLEGREPAGTVASRDHAQVMEELRDDIMALRNHDTGRPAAAEVVFPQRLYAGPLTGHLPDVVVRWRNDAPILRLECPKHGTIEDGLRFVDKTHSSHTGRGVAFIAGPGIGHSVAENSADLRDLNATMFALCGAAPPGHLEGRPIDLSGAAVAGPPGDA